MGSPSALAMPPTIDLAALEQQKSDVLRGVSRWSPRQLAYRPQPPAWSALEVLDHLVRVEREILIAMRRGLHSPHRLGLRDRAGVALLDWLFRSDRRVRVPKSVPQILPTSDATLESIGEDWAHGRRDLGEFLSSLSLPQHALGIFQHPVAGWMTVPQILRFFWVHTHHHGFQLARLEAASKVDRPPDPGRVRVGGRG